MKKSQLIRLLEDVPDDYEIQVEFPDGDEGTNTAPIHSVVIEHDADGSVSVVIRL